LVGNRAALAGLVIVGVLVLGASAADWLPLKSPVQMAPQSRMAEPSWGMPFGADAFGRDLLSRTVYGARLSLQVATVSVTAALIAGTLLGLVAGYAGGRVDQLLMRAMDVFFSFPAILLALGIVAALGPSPNNVILAIAVPMVPRCARVVRSSALAVREMPYVDAARAAGFGHRRIILRHMLPNVMAPILIMMTAFLGEAILLEASLSFLGLGVQEPVAAWGLMLRGAAVQFAESAPWMAIFPGLAISLGVFGFNLFGDSLRDALDPRLRTQ